MAEGPTSEAQREAILQRTIAEIEEKVDETVRTSKKKKSLEKKFYIEISYNAKTTNERVKQSLIDKYKSAGWDKAYFSLDTQMNETIYQFVLEQA